MRKVFGGLVVLIGLLLLALPAAAQTPLVVELGDTIRGAPGSIHTVYSGQTPPDMIGMTCLGSVTAVNNTSLHPNNDMIITSGASSARIVNYENVVNGTTSASSELTLGDTIVIEVQLGPDGISSEVFDVALACAQPPPTTTTTVAPPTTTPPPTTPPPTTTPTTTPPPTTPPPTSPDSSSTTESPPSGGVEAGGGGTAGGSPAAPWVGAGALLLAAALTAAAAGRALASRRD